MPQMLKELRSQHRNVIQMAFNGYKNNEIAERLGMAASSVSTIIRSPLGQAYLHGLQDRQHEATLDVRKKLVGLNKAALQTFEHLLDKSSRKSVPALVQFNAAKDVLDRNGYKAPDRLNIDMTLQTKTDEELDAEIAAIEAAINKTPQTKNLPGIKESLKTALTESPSASSPSDSDYFSFASAASSPDTTAEDELSLEDFNDSDIFGDQSFEEPVFVEDPMILENLPLDLFRNTKRS